MKLSFRCHFEHILKKPILFHFTFICSTQQNKIYCIASETFKFALHLMSTWHFDQISCSIVHIVFHYLKTEHSSLLIFELKKKVVITQHTPHATVEDPIPLFYFI